MWAFKLLDHCALPQTVSVGWPKITATQHKGPHLSIVASRDGTGTDRTALNLRSESWTNWSQFWCGAMCDALTDQISCSLCGVFVLASLLGGSVCLPVSAVWSSPLNERIMYTYVYRGDIIAYGMQRQGTSRRHTCAAETTVLPARSAYLLRTLLFEGITRENAAFSLFKEQSSPYDTRFKFANFTDGRKNQYWWMT